MRIFLCSFAILFLGLLYLYGPRLILEGSFISKLFGVVAVSAVCSFTVHYLYRPRIKSLAKKAVLITGCDTGFGHLLAKRMEQQGFTVFACCFNANSKDSKQLDSGSGLMHILQMDVTNEDQIQNCVETVEETLRKEGKDLWAVVNNAGIGLLGFIEMSPIDTYQRVYDVNTLGTVRVSKAFIPFLRGHGRVINVASLASRISTQYISAYAMSKHATLAFSDSLRREMAPFNIKVVTIEPEFYRTNILQFTKLTDWIDEMWNSTKDDIRDQYGIVYVKACEDRILTTLTKDSRTNLNEVIDTLEQAIWEIEPKFHYMPHAPTAFKVNLMLRFLPEFSLDQGLKKAWCPRDVKPAFMCRTSS